MRQGQRQLSRFQAQSQDMSQVAATNGDPQASTSSPLSGWDAPDLLALINQVSPLWSLWRHTPASWLRVQCAQVSLWVSLKHPDQCQVHCLIGSLQLHMSQPADSGSICLSLTLPY